MKTAKVLWGATDLGVPHFSGDILWKTVFRAPDGFFLVEIGGRTTLLLSSLEIGRAKKEARADEVLLFESFLKRGESPAHGLIRFLKAQKIREIIVPHTFPHGIARILGETFAIHDGGHSLYPLRARKTKKEIAEITAAQRACEDALYTAVAFLRSCIIKGNRVYDAARVITSEIIRRIINDALWQKGYLASGTIVACGAQAADPHCRGYGPIAARQPIVMDIFPVSLATHYWADMTRTVFKGEPSNDFVRMYEAVLGAQEAAIKMIRAGIDGAAAHRAAAEYLSSAGFPTRITGGRAEGFTHGLGHGVGIDIHEQPHLGTRSEILAEGNVITIEPGLYYPKARKGIPAGGIRIEDMAVVRKNGCDLITQFPKDFKTAVL
ncbi:MAG: Xaa-Pro peptidase family protein [Candidatus Sungiibacteriota bacterium]